MKVKSMKISTQRMTNTFTIISFLISIRIYSWRDDEGNLSRKVRDPFAIVSQKDRAH